MFNIFLCMPRFSQEFHASAAPCRLNVDNTHFTLYYQLTRTSVEADAAIDCVATKKGKHKNTVIVHAKYVSIYLLNSTQHACQCLLLGARAFQTAYASNKEYSLSAVKHNGTKSLHILRVYLICTASEAPHLK